MLARDIQELIDMAKDKTTKPDEMLLWRGCGENVTKPRSETLSKHRGLKPRGLKPHGLKPCSVYMGRTWLVVANR